MKILVVNPNTSQDFTRRIAATVARYAARDTEFTMVCPDQGPRSIEGIFDALLSSAPTLQAVLGCGAQYDAILMACYGDLPVVSAVREITDKPVLSIAEASMHMACMLGQRFGIVTSSERWVPLLADGVRRFGLSERCACIRAIGMPVLACEAPSREATFAAILKTALDCRDQDRAEVICLGSAGMTGWDKELEAVLKVPVLDGVVCALKILEGMGAYGLHTSKRLTFTNPIKKELLNLPPVFETAYAEKDPWNLV
jgi:allantoin racemase